MANKKKVIVYEEPIQELFGLTYASFQVLPRSILQSMPVKWQKRFVALMNEIDTACWQHGIECGPYAVYLRDDKGRLAKCPYTEYERGRRNVFKEKGHDLRNQKVS